MNTNHTPQEHMMNEAIRYALRLYHVQKHELAHSVKYLKHHLSRTIGKPVTNGSIWMGGDYESLPMDSLTSVEKKVIQVAVKYMRDTEDRSMHQMMA